jgi:hypothetical protein
MPGADGRREQEQKWVRDGDGEEPSRIVDFGLICDVFGLSDSGGQGRARQGRAGQQDETRQGKAYPWYRVGPVRRGEGGNVRLD